MKQKLLNFSRLRAILLTALFSLAFTSAWAQSDYSKTETSNATLTAGTNGTACTVNTYDGIKLGTSSKGGDMKVTVPAGTTHLHLHAAAWKGVTGLSLDITGATADPESISLTADEGISNNSPFTLTGEPEDFYFVVELSGITADTELTLKTSTTKRCVIWGVNAETVSGTITKPSISAENVNLAYDATGGEIAFTINNPVTGGVLTAALAKAETDDWLNVGDVATDNNTVALNCDPNNGAERTATVTLTYTYGNDAVTKNVTVKQAANPNGPGSEENPYTVEQARAAIDAGTGVTGVYATGIVSEIVTAYNGQYGNITFNIVDNEGDQVFLQAYRCGGDEAANVEVGDVVVISGNLTKYNSTYEFGQGCTVVSLTHPDVPRITADDVEIAFDATSGAIAFTVENPAPSGEVTATVPQGSWLTLGTVGTTVPFTCEANTTAASRTETVTLTYAYDGKAATKEVTVTQAGNPNLTNNISDITEVGVAYSVKGTVVATNSRGFVMGDGTGYVYYYKNGAVSQAIGDMVAISGTTGTYGQIIQFTNSATVAEATSSNYDNTPAVEVITAVPDYTEGYHLSTYLQFEGALAKSNNNYFITVGEAQIQISYPTTDQGNALSALDGKDVVVKGYFSGINSSSKFTVMLESVEEVANTDPVITIAPDKVEAPATGVEGTLTVTYTNIEAGGTIVMRDATGAPATFDWISVEFDNNNNVSYAIAPNSGEARSAYLEINNQYKVISNVVTITQAGFVAPTFAELPFEFDGGKADIEATDGLTQEGLDSDYGSSPKLKFNSTDDYLLLAFDERPGTLTFDIKGNSFSGGTFTVQTSEDGVTFADLETYTSLAAAQNEEFNLGENVRYVKWIYTEKVNGNVALGNIKLTEYVAPTAYTLTFTDDEHSELFVFDNDNPNDALESPAQVLSGTTIMVSIDIDENYIQDQFVVIDAEGQDVKLTYNAEGYYYTFTMPASNTTIRLTTKELPPATTYSLATTIVPGKHYIIANSAEDGDAMAMGEQKNNNRAAVAVTIANGKARVSSEEVYELVICGPVAGLYTIYDAQTPGYLYAASSGSNHLKSQASTNVNGLWDINFTESGAASIVAVESENRNVMQYNGGSTIFSCYASDSQAPVYLYEKDDDTPVEADYARTVTAGNFGTICLPQTATIVGAELYSIAGVDDEKTILSLTEVKGTAKAGVPYIFKATESTLSAYSTGEAVQEAESANGLIGSFDGTRVEEGMYLLSGGKVVKCGTGCSINANKAYIDLDAVQNSTPAGDEAGVKLYIDGTPDGIEAIENAQNVKEVYDLAGRRVARPIRGIYIVNGQKVLVK